jgi:hypothetical protein
VLIHTSLDQNKTRLADDFDDFALTLALTAAALVPEPVISTTVAEVKAEEDAAGGRYQRG